MTTTDESATEAVRAFVERRRRDPDWNDEHDALAAAAMAVARVLDTTENGSASANASRELRQTLLSLRRPEHPEEPSALDEILERRRRRLEGDPPNPN